MLSPPDLFTCMLCIGLITHAGRVLIRSEERLAGRGVGIKRRQLAKFLEGRAALRVHQLVEIARALDQPAAFFVAGLEAVTDPDDVVEIPRVGFPRPENLRGLAWPTDDLDGVMIELIDLASGLSVDARSRLLAVCRLFVGQQSDRAAA